MKNTAGNSYKGVHGMTSFTADEMERMRERNNDNFLESMVTVGIVCLIAGFFLGLFIGKLPG